MSNRRLILVELNEVNLDVARSYVPKLGLKHFEQLLSAGVRRTSSESEYEQLEPWIQWVSAHSGLTAAEHAIFRLGDIVGSGVPQIFEQVEAAGLSVGAVSPMNTENRLRSPAYFIPDPWTRTPTDGSGWSRRLWTAISQAVNDNSSGRITAGSAFALACGLLRFAQPRHYDLYLSLLRRSRGAPWRKALFLDLFLHDLHVRLYGRHRPNFSTLFLNAGAHIQHHYFFNGKLDRPVAQRNPAWYIDPSADPIAEMLQVYDAILGDYLRLPDASLLVATGLTQVPYERVTFYYRLKDHAAFLRMLGIRHVRVLPRMTRDFVIEFADAADAASAQRSLSALRFAHDGELLFAEIDNRGDSLFVTLTYPNEIEASALVEGAAAPFLLAGHVVFVAIKNGMHAAHGYVCGVGEVTPYLPAEGDHVKELNRTLQRFFALVPGAAE
ncbi:hypothetical protein DFR24_4404 [Panacagrimonas perspica]|uniref:Type I phosphodiesterase/nucleotide pyrophosphatase n=1 Tax=Panacagrimonas perspica TaxID=381431 RepID=A0A4R7NU27_9GAMM|nr:hypothetical protein DFR24_4404 [Panacagrimonas perspica]THD04557.1 hypothetical protein B1810_03815 [Panacagrimonas perspica]